MDHTHDDYMGRKETDRLVGMFQTSLSNINSTLSSLDNKLDNYAPLAHDVTDIKNTLTEMNGTQKGLLLWQASHVRHHELVDTEETAYRRGRSSVFGEMHWGWKALGAAFAMLLVGGEAARLLGVSP